MTEFSPTKQHSDYEEIANPLTAGEGATGLTPKVLSLPPRLSMRHAGIDNVSLCGTLISVHVSSIRERTARSPTVFIG